MVLQGSHSLALSQALRALILFCSCVSTFLLFDPNVKIRGVCVCGCVFIPVTRRVKGYTRFVGKYVTGRRKRFRPHKVYIFLTVCPSVRMNAEISETVGARMLRLCMQIQTTTTLKPV